MHITLAGALQEGLDNDKYSERNNQNGNKPEDTSYKEYHPANGVEQPTNNAWQTKRAEHLGKEWLCLGLEATIEGALDGVEINFKAVENLVINQIVRRLARLIEDKAKEHQRYAQDDETDGQKPD